MPGRDGDYFFGIGSAAAVETAATVIPAAAPPHPPHPPHLVSVPVRARVWGSLVGSHLRVLWTHALVLSAFAAYAARSFRVRAWFRAVRPAMCSDLRPRVFRVLPAVCVPEPSRGVLHPSDSS